MDEPTNPALDRQAALDRCVEMLDTMQGLVQQVRAELWDWPGCGEADHAVRLVEHRVEDAMNAVLATMEQFDG